MGWTCKKCGEMKPVEQFQKDRRSQTGHRQPCQACKNKARAEWSKRNPEKERRRVKRERQKKRRRERARYPALRQNLLAAYGGRCACCGETTPEFLTVDHINNDGREHRRACAMARSKFYYWLEKKKFPKDNFQLLCMNCNTAKFRYGECPHARAHTKVA